MGAAEALGPDVAAQAITDVVGLADGVGLIIKRYQAGNRAKNLFLRDTHAVVDVGEHGWQDIVATFDAFW